jgi:uncharacterized membrane protein
LVVGKFLLVLLALAYPLLVYYGLLHFPVKWVALAIAALLLLRLLLLRRQISEAGKALYPAILLGVVCALTSVVLNQAGALRLIPVLINVSCLIAFALTLRHPPSMIERFARLQDPILSPDAIAYTRKVTIVWCVFFVLNGSTALYTALYTSMEIWTLYNGLIAYILMGLLFAVEYLVRLRVKARSKSS